MRTWFSSGTARPFVAVLVLVAALSQGIALGATARKDSFHVVQANEDRFLNYDFTEPGATARNKTDWPVALVFHGNAEIDKVKNRLKGQMKWKGGPKYFVFNGGGGWYYDQDSGIKTGHCPNPAFTPTAYHMRLYADGNDRFYNRLWSHYVLATAHIDHNECWITDRWFGRTETAEKNIARFAGNVSGWTVRWDRWNLFNPEPFRKEEDHHWENNGWATGVRVP